MSQRIVRIKRYISELHGVKIITRLKENKGVIEGAIEVSQEEDLIEFDIFIYPQYPFQFHNAETIRFVNKGLKSYNHVGKDGSVCLHTLHSPDLKTKLHFDFNSLKHWIHKYYILKVKDTHYEHIIVPVEVYKRTNMSFLFTEVKHQFKKGEFGILKYSPLASGFYESKEISTYIIQGFTTGKAISNCNWNDYYKGLQTGEGIYVFIEEPPAEYGRFIVENWVDLENYVDQKFILFLNAIQNRMYAGNKEDKIPLLIGYRIPNNEVHWQCAIINATRFPNYAVKRPGNIDEGHFYDEEVNWTYTQNCSHKYFFGRGALDKHLTEKKILIIGIGAIGSILATTLTRGGCKQIALVDYDIKGAENVCRSEYAFNTGLNGKVSDLTKRLIHISPFIRVTPFENFTDAIKFYINSGEFKINMKSDLEQFDIIFDCSADNDLAFIIDSFDLKSEVINLSITNYAKELVCVTNPNLYKWLNEIYTENLTPSRPEELYNPTGCWDPTFKASYNDVALMVQYTIQKINHSYTQTTPLRNFYLQKDDNMNIKQIEF